MDTITFDVTSGDDHAVVDLTDRIQAWLDGRGDGLCNVFVPHATAGVTILEPTPGTIADTRTAMDELLPRDGRWQHRHGSPGHGADHVAPLLIAPGITIPVLDGALALGTWQAVVLVDTNRDNPVRTIRLSFLAG